MKNIKFPGADEFGFVKTLNNQGFMTDYLDDFSAEFVAFSAQAPGPVLDLGAAYGVATIPALTAGARVIANDLDGRHLDVLSSIAHSTVSPQQMQNLTLMPGRFPEELSFQSGSLGAVLACRVFHFFDGPTIEAGVARIFNWLAPGGRFFLVGETPYVGGLSAFRPVYEERRSKGDLWPGFIEDFMRIDPSRGRDLPKSMHLLDEAVLTRVLSSTGFEIVRVGTIARPKFPPNLKLDGRESVGIIGLKRT